jgi:hypothetical protein
MAISLRTINYEPNNGRRLISFGMHKIVAGFVNFCFTTLPFDYYQKIEKFLYLIVPP